MGSKQTKMEGTYLPSTPLTKEMPSELNMNLNSDSSLNARSPTEYRTPNHLQYKRVDSNVQLASVAMPEREPYNENALDILRKRFFKSFTYNLNDPRSPSLNLNRTPLVFEDALEKSLRLDDTFADLFVESRLPVALNKSEQPKENVENEYEQYPDSEMPEEKVIIDLEDRTAAPQTPKVLQQEFDPRSPSIGVERTPIIFTDDDVDEDKEDVMLESILATLSLNLNTSGNSSMASTASQNGSANFNDKIDLQGVARPMNKHLHRVRVGKKNSPKAKHHKPKRRSSHQQIYEDQENHIPLTPKLKVSQSDKNDSLKGKRTPLSCVRNRNATHIRSRSVESSHKPIKAEIALTSFDDTLNPTENHKIPNLRIMQQFSQDSLEL